MLNQVVLVGRLVRNPELGETINGQKTSKITLAVPRSYKNIEGNYETDFINCTLWRGVASNTAEYCKKGDIVGIKGRLEVDSYEKDNEKRYITNVIAEKVTFLSNNTKKSTNDVKE